MNKLRLIWQEKWKILKFNLVGGLNTLIDIAVFSALTHWFSLAFVVANVLSYSCGLINSYVLNRYWTFRDNASETKRQTGAELIRFLIVNGLTLGINTALIGMFKAYASFSPDLAKITATVITLALNYIGYSRLVFRNKPVS